MSAKKKVNPLSTKVSQLGYFYMYTIFLYLEATESFVVKSVFCLVVVY